MPKGNTIAHIFPALRNSSLLSVGQLWDRGREAHFDANKVTIGHQGKIMLTGKHSKGTLGKLWIFDPYLPPPEPAAQPPAKDKIHSYYVFSMLQ
jgi:hypothetical protein